MPQNPLAATIGKNPSNAQQTGNYDAGGAFSVSGGGLSSKLNVTAAVAVKATAGRLCKIVVIAPGTTSGSLTINDCATTGAATTANEVFTIGYAAMSVGQVITLDFPCQVGIVVSAVPGGGSPQYAISFS
jgi:hypothetical protein